LTYQFIDVMKGKINAESQVGHGTTFTITLPRNLESNTVDVNDKLINPSISEQLQPDTHAIPDEQGSEDNELAIQINTDTSSIHILVVEDHPALRRYLASVISPYYIVHTAENGLDAWENALPNTGYQLIMTDVIMPFMDGFELLAKIKSDDRFRHIPVIMLTALSDIRDKLKALRIGVDDYILKPFVEEELLARIENLLRHRAMRSEYAQAEVSLREDQLDLLLLNMSLKSGFTRPGCFLSKTRL